jgi:uncharacterized damage-inducible protein DinB
MIRQLEDFYKEWAYESESTLKLFALIDEKRFHEQAHDRVRSISRLACHITETIGEMMNHTGLAIDGYSHETDLYWTKHELIDAYKRFSDSLIEQLKKNWKDSDLEKKDNMYGEEWSRGTTLNVLIKHQAHHRGELVVLMRLLGMTPIGVYGPAAEEWASMGMAPMQ